MQSSTPVNRAKYNGMQASPHLQKVAGPSNTLAQSAKVVGLKLRNAGRFGIGKRHLRASEGLFNVPGAPGYLINKAPGLGKVFLVTETRTKRVIGIRYSRSRCGWVKVSSREVKRLAANPSNSKSERRFALGRLIQNLFSFLGDENVWIPARFQRYQQSFQLGDEGLVHLENGATMSPGDPAVTLPDGETLNFTGQDLTVHVNGEVVGRWRWFPDCNTWKQHVNQREVTLKELGLQGECSTRGEVTFRDPSAGSLRLKNVSSFSLHLGEHQTLVRPSDSSSFYLVDSRDDKVQEFAIDGGKIFELKHVADALVYTLLGCPGGVQRPKASIEVVPGAIMIRDSGAVFVLGRAYLPGESISLTNGAIRVERAAGMREPLWVRTPTSVTGYLFESTEWYLITPRINDRPAYRGTTNGVACGFQWMEDVSWDAPMMGTMDRFLFALARTERGLTQHPMLFGVGQLVGPVLAVSLYVGYWASRLIGIPWSVTWQFVCHVRRAIELAKQ